MVLYYWHAFIYSACQFAGDDNGHPTLKSTGCSLNIGGLKVHFHGGASWLYNLFDHNIADALKSSLKGQVSAVLQTPVYFIRRLVIACDSSYVQQLQMLSIPMETRHLKHFQVMFVTQMTINLTIHLLFF